MSLPGNIDYIIIGSGFGGSVAALRLAEKGYKVAVLEQGKRFSTEDFPESDWNLKKFLWAPVLGWHGILRCHFFKEVFVLTGTGVGGGSLVYANTLMKPGDDFFGNPAWQTGINWKGQLEDHYETARKMLGANRFPVPDNAEDLVLKEIAVEMDREESFSLVDTAVYYGDREKETDPYFGGAGPLRKGCSGCAGCMTGCRENAKNTLDKNYLWFAEKLGVQIFPETKAYKIENTEGKYRVSTKKSGRKGVSGLFEARGLIVSAGTTGTLELLLKQKYRYKSLTNLSDSIGNNVRTNSQSISGLVEANRKLNNGVAITSIFSPEPGTHIEMVKFNDRSGAITHIGGFSADHPSPGKRAGHVITSSLRHPFKLLKLLFSFRWGKRSIVMLVMQTHDSAMRMELKRGLSGTRLRFDRNSGKVPAFIPTGQKVLHKYAQKVNGTPLNSLTESLFNMSTTAHIIGGCPMGKNGSEGTVDADFRVHGYENMYILDSSIIPCNPGVNPSLTILALSEYAMGKINPKA
ncbi:MAG: cholesterol oxidase [Bacteroidetes bacterium]|nr:MAG: cholesterol oxidase [Bacteroidota bacterium]